MNIIENTAEDGNDHLTASDNKDVVESIGATGAFNRGLKYVPLEIIHECIDLLMRDDEWVERLRSKWQQEVPRRDYQVGYIGALARSGRDAGASRAITHLIVQRYAELENLDMGAEKIGAVVDGKYDANSRR